ncbi:hypothetical protein ABGB12_01260 [Actinocorallia sp. B10E7]|uniref:hypothetical protein n=1 Tax=Actinocorallia sp. B10E7 TaxID=3153558 RepID=UPI00325E37DC
MQLLDAFERHPVEAAVVAVCALAAVLLVTGLVVRGLRAARRGRVEGQRVVTLLGAAIATGLSAQGMYVFFRDSVEVPPVLRIVFFAFLEIMVLGSALRAKASMQEKYSAGIDGIAMWTFTILSSVLAATHAHGLGETLFRLSVPLAAAWAWEREMKLERRRRTGRGGLNWTLTPERILTRLGLADPTDRTASEAGSQHRLMRLALAAKKARIARDSGDRKAYAKALRKLDKAMDRAAELTGLGTDSSRPQAPEEILVGRLAVLYNTESLLDLQPPAPWAPPAPALTPVSVTVVPQETAPVAVPPQTVAPVAALSQTEAAAPEAAAPQTVPRTTDPVAAPAQEAAPVVVPPQAAPPETERVVRRAKRPAAEPVTAEAERSAPSAAEAVAKAAQAATVVADSMAAAAQKRQSAASQSEEPSLDGAEALWPFPPRRGRRSTTTSRTSTTRTTRTSTKKPSDDAAAPEAPQADTAAPARRTRQTRTARPKAE